MRNDFHGARSSGQVALPLHKLSPPWCRTEERLRSTYPAVQDPDAAEPRVTHLSSTPWGHAWPVDAQALCGSRPQRYWQPTRNPSTCPACRAAACSSLSTEVEHSVAQFTRFTANIERLRQQIEALQASERDRQERLVAMREGVLQGLLRETVPSLRYLRQELRRRKQGLTDEDDARPA